MAERILIISHGIAFLANALEENLKQASIPSAQAEPSIESIRRHEEDTDLFLLFPDPDAPLPIEAMQYLKDVTTAYKRKRFCVVGYSETINKVEEVLPSDAIDREFLRPIDVKTLTEELASMLNRADDETMREKHILLVDDDVTFLRIMQGWLSEQYRVTALKSGMQALTFIATQQPDLILLDYDMPVTSGVQVLEMIRSERHTRDIPVIFLTGVNDRDRIMQAMHLFPNGYLLKTASKTAIFETIEEYFQEHETKRSVIDDGSVEDSTLLKATQKSGVSA